jgi:Ctf8
LVLSRIKEKKKGELMLKRQKTDEAGGFWESGVEQEDGASSSAPSTGAQVAIRLPPPTSDTPEGRKLPVYTLIELQGSLLSTGTGSSGSSGSTAVARPDSTVEFEGRTIGTLEMQKGPRDAKATPVLCIGSHYLDGRVVKLETPVLITQQSDSGDTAATGADDAEYASEFVILGVAHQKLLFKNRPRFNLK